jgi:hypothetical protein
MIPMLGGEVVEGQHCVSRSFVAAEGKDSLVHLLGIEHLETHEQMEVLYRQPGDGQKQVRLEKYESDEDAVDDLNVETENEIQYARECLDDVLFSCGWLGEKTEKPFDSSPGLSTTYLSWWAFKPSEIVERFRVELRTILLEATSAVHTIPLPE